jgi:hypothetical protein
MHRCPHCQQEMNSFAFYCLRCGKVIGKVEVDGVLIVALWVDINTNSSEKVNLKTLKQNSVYKDIARISEPYPSSKTEVIMFTLTDGRAISQSIPDFYREASSTSQEWNLS